MTDSQAPARADGRSAGPEAAWGGDGAHPGSPGLGLAALGALGIVYGDIGTSPLYSMQTVFSIGGGVVRPTPTDVLGVVSLVFWSITVVVAAKYLGIVLRADDQGEGGVLVLSTVARRAVSGRRRLAAAMVTLGLVGACLFYGDSIITPAISVLSSIQGLEVPYPALHRAVVPLAVVVLAALFVLQRRGTARVGALFGPVMVGWFAALAAVGIHEIAAHPGVVRGLSPTYAFAFAVHAPAVAFVAMGAVVLAITGAEALYADMGHFGRRPIRLAWFGLVFPALTADYLGQAALVLAHPAARANPFFDLLPGWAQIPMVLLATAATVIASQAVISGSYSMTRQAVQLGYLPPMTVRQTSESAAGQIYMPAVNWLVFVAVMVLVVTFHSATNLANAYGVAVTGTFVTTTCMLLVLTRVEWRWPRWRVALLGLVLLGLELVFFAGNVLKVVSGGWLPLGVAVVLLTIMTTWRRGRLRVTARRVEAEGPLADFIARVHRLDPARTPGTAIFPHPTMETAPLALRANLEHNGVLHERVVILSAEPRAVARVPAGEQLVVDDLGSPSDGIVHLAVRYGFFDRLDLPASLAAAAEREPLLAGVDVAHASWFVSRATLSRGPDPAMAAWRKRLFISLAHNAADPAQTFGLPADRTVVMGTRLEI